MMYNALLKNVFAMTFGSFPVNIEFTIKDKLVLNKVRAHLDYSAHLHKKL
jgi:hypothetical protein